MNQANQRALAQLTNQGLLNIRQAELNYYINLNVAFGTQAALIGGFTYGIFTQTVANDSNSYSCVFLDLFWIVSSGTVASAVHVILATMMLQVLGPGLALHGPIGSMVTACEGMRREQKTVIAGFIIMMAFFSIATILAFWVTMTPQAAAFSTFVWVVALRMYYYYCERIYLRFFWKVDKGVWEKGDETDPAAMDDDEPGVSKSQSPLHKQERSDSIARHGSNDSDRRNSKRDSRRVGLLSSLRWRRRSSSEGKASRRSSAVSGVAMGELTPSSHPHAIAMEGFLLVRRRISSKMVPTLDYTQYKWDRRYFTITYSGHLYYYNNRAHFRETPLKPIHKRPLILSNFFIEVYNSSTRSPATADPALGDKVLFQITLLPREDMIGDDNEDENAFSESEHESVASVSVSGETAAGKKLRRHWSFRTDTAEELESWLDIMRTIAPSSFV